MAHIEAQLHDIHRIIPHIPVSGVHVARLSLVVLERKTNMAGMKRIVFVLYLQEDAALLLRPNGREQDMWM